MDHNHLFERQLIAAVYQYIEDYVSFFEGASIDRSNTRNFKNGVFFFRGTYENMGCGLFKQ